MNGNRQNGGLYPNPQREAAWQRIYVKHLVGGKKKAYNTHFMDVRLTGSSI